MNSHAASLAVAVGAYVIGFYMLMGSLIQPQFQTRRLILGFVLVAAASLNLYQAIA